MGVRMIIYLADILLMAENPPKIEIHRNSTLFLLQKLGFLINWKKSSLNPTQVSGFSDKFGRNDVLPTNRKGISDKNKMQRNVKCRNCNSIPLAQLTGKLSSFMQAIFPANLQSRFLQMDQIKGGTTATDSNRVSQSCGVENFRGRSPTEELSKAAAELHEKAWRPGTQLSYKNSWGKWFSWCIEQSVNPFQVTLATVIEFLTKLFKDGLQYRTINTYRSAMPKNHPLIDSLQVGKHPLIIRHMRAIFNERTPTSKYEFSWDVDIVLNEILSWIWEVEAGNKDELGIVGPKKIEDQDRTTIKHNQ
ncbi:unnamed protein product [Mytilus coruscus]|uniref:Core-binding (CB) domain-containing protein n=1 Tax=Mytilus coruscus TaxID=42192 RepID=A0A6J7ZUZ3_MYTCO|nr:unnamed protein product [Mytilus coruscus]